MPSVTAFRQFDFSGGVQSATSYLLRKRNEVQGAKNAVFNYHIGAAARRFGYEQVGQTIQYNNDSNGFHIFKYGNSNKMLASINSADGSQSTIQFLDSNNYWATVSTPVTIDPDTKIRWQDALDQSFIVGKSLSRGTFIPTMSIDSNLNVSTTANVYNAPRGKFIVSFQGKLVILNTQVNGVNYPSRFYVSSAPTGAITFIQNPQSGMMWQLHVDSVRYIKVGMTLDIFTGGTNALQNTITITSVDKVNNNFGFNPITVSLKDRDEVWITGKKGTTTPLSYLWNTDYPTNENADWVRIPSGQEEIPEITGARVINNRLLVFTKNQTWKWDGANLVQISDQIGCVSDESAQVLGYWMIWLHTTGIWAYNDVVGQFRLLSRGIQNYILAVNPVSFSRASAVVAGRIYKVSVGEIGVLDASTTSTSTSSTSTSSTSSSTSSTSTSSTSTSSTVSTTTSTSSTSVSSTSSSTSSTSSSISTSTSASTSISISTSTTSQSTSTSSTTTTTATNNRRILRLCYDFDSNIWWPEYHTREIRYQLMHTMNSYTKPYFTDDTGKVFRDETSNTDAGDAIPFEFETGRNNFGTEQVKNLIGCYIEVQNARGALLYVSVDGGQYQQIAQVTKNNQQLRFPGNLKTGRDISYKFVHNNPSDRPAIVGISTYFSMLESVLGGSVGRIGG